MSGGPFAVMLVWSVSHALRIEKLLGGRGIPCRLVPVPRHLSSDCGVAVRFLQEDAGRAEDAVRAAGVDFDAVHPL